MVSCHIDYTYTIGFNEGAQFVIFLNTPKLAKHGDFSVVLTYACNIISITVYCTNSYLQNRFVKHSYNFFFWIVYVVIISYER